MDLGELARTEGRTHASTTTALGGTYGVERAVRLEALLEQRRLVLGQAQLLAPPGAVLLVAAGARALELPPLPLVAPARERGGAVGRRGRPRRRRTLLLPRVPSCTYSSVGEM
jgi:hypothetical protein